MGFDAKMEGYELVEVDGRVCLRMGSILCREKLPIGADGEYHPENPVKMAGEYISLGEFQEISETELKQWLGRK